jgi:hypothetical protein
LEHAFENSLEASVSDFVEASELREKRSEFGGEEFGRLLHGLLELTKKGALLVG